MIESLEMENNKISNHYIEKLAEQILSRNISASESYSNVVTTITSFIAPIYLFLLRQLLCETNQLIKWWHVLPPIFLLLSLAVIFWARFPRKTFFDLNNPVQILENQFHYLKKVRSYSIIASVLAWLGIAGCVLVVLIV
jgi:hypothetical protein